MDAKGRPHDDDEDDPEDDFVSTSSESFCSTLSSSSNSNDLPDIVQESDVLTAPCIQAHGWYYPHHLSGAFSVPLVTAIDMLKENARQARRSIVSPMQQGPPWMWQLPHGPYYDHQSYDPWQHVCYQQDHSAHGPRISPQSPPPPIDNGQPRTEHCRTPLVERIRGAPLPPLPAAVQKERADRQWRTIFTC